MAGSWGYQTQLAVSSASPAAAGRLDYERESLALDEQFLDLNGLRGTRSRHKSRVRRGNRAVSGSLVLQPTEVDLATILPWCFGGTPTGSPTVTYPLADLLYTRYVTVDRGGAVHTYSGVAVDAVTFYGTQGEPLQVTLDLVGQDESVGAAGSFPALSLDTSASFIFQDLYLTLATSLDVQVRNFTLRVQNMIDRGRFFNGLTLTEVRAMDRVVTLSCLLPYGDYDDLYSVLNDEDGVEATAAFANGSKTLTFDMPAVMFPRKSPVVEGRQEVMLPVAGTAYRTASELELITTIA